MKYIAIGDIHGCFDQLVSLMATLAEEGDARLVFLGDYIDMGRDSKKVIQFLLDLKNRRPDTIFLTGNHEQELLLYMRGGDFVRYAKKGGLSTIRSYCGVVTGDVRLALVSSIPEEHLSFLENLLVFFEDDDYLFSHAGCAPSDFSERTLDSMVLRSHKELIAGDASLHKMVVCGHYFQPSFWPLIRKNLIVVDTGCGVLGGPLSAVKLPSLEVFQAKQS